MKIDLHCHTRATKKGDGSGRNVLADDFVAAISGEGVEVVAITNHNAFDAKQYEDFSEKVKGIAQIWPGVELDVHNEDSSSHWHTIAITSPSNVHVFAEAVESLLNGESANTFCCTFKEAFEAFKGFDTIYIAHCHDKAPCASEEDIEYMQSVAERNWGLFFEPRTLVTAGIWSNHGRSMMLGSDVKDWSRYEEYCTNLPSLRLPIDSFEQFILLCKRDKSVINTLLNVRPSRSIRCSPHKNVFITIPIYPEINVLFGQKGTGKSEILKSLLKTFENEGRSCVFYDAPQKSSQFDELLSTSTMTRDVTLFGRSDCESDLKELKEWKDALPTPIQSYAKWIETRGNNKKKSHFKISECEELAPVSLNKYEIEKNSYLSIKSFCDDYHKNSYQRYLSEEDRLEFERILSILKSNSLRQVQSVFIERKAIELTNASLTLLKNSIDGKSETLSKPNSTGFMSFALSRIRLKTICNRIEENLKEGTEVVSDYLGKLDDKGVLTLNSEYRYLCSSTKKEEVDGISFLRKWKKAFNEVCESIFSSDAGQKLVDLIALDKDKNIASLTPFIGLRRYITLEDGTQYSPSEGEKGIVLLERKLSEDADIYILDEPESGMSNSYTETVTRPRIQQLGAMGKYVIIATHNANIGVRTLPYSSIYREHSSGNEYRTYSGNPFRDELVDIADSSNSMKWSQCSMEILEGGPEAFFGRKAIYEAGEF